MGAKAPVSNDSDESVADEPREDPVNVVPAGQVSDVKPDNKQAAAVADPGLANTGMPELLLPIVLVASAGILGGAALMIVKRRRRMAK